MCVVKIAETLEIVGPGGLSTRVIICPVGDSKRIFFGIYTCHRIIRIDFKNAVISVNPFVSTNPNTAILSLENFVNAVARQTVISS